MGGTGMMLEPKTLLEHRMLSRRALLVLPALLALQALPGRLAAAEPPVFTGIVKGVAVGGYDPVAYFTDGKPVAGTDAHAIDYNGVKWRFASAANRDAFKAEPEKFAPRYGGYCAYAVSQGYTAKGDPEAWSIVDGKLYLNYSKAVRATWEKDKAAYIVKGDSNWPGVLTKQK